MKFEEYMAMPDHKKFEYFMKSRFSTDRTPQYWVNWDNVKKNMAEHELNLNTLNYLVGKKDIKKEAKNLFQKQPQLLKTIPILLAAREKKIDVLALNKNNIKAYTVDFANPDLDKLDTYLSFMSDSGLLNFLSKDLKTSLVDYVFGVEAGLDSNGRKNRGGKQNEEILAHNLQIAMSKNKDLEISTQATGDSIKSKWGIKVPESIDENAKGGRRYDGAVFNKKTRKVTIIETNFYGCGGSKLKSVAGEFSNLYTYIKKNSQNEINFVWISDGPGWDTAKNPMEEAFQVIPNIFNLKMVRDGYLDEILKL